MPDAHKNFAYSTVAVAPSPAASGTTLSVQAGEGARFPAPPFNAVVCPAGALALPGNAEVVRVTAMAGDAVSVMIRQQESSSARTIQVGDQFYAGATAKTITDIEGAGGQSTTLARTYRTAALGGLVANQWNKVACDTAQYDPGSNLTLASSRFVCPVSGYYLVEGQITSGTSNYCGVLKNGALSTSGNAGSNTSCSDVLYCNAGDYLELGIYPTGTAALSSLAATNNFLSVALIGAGIPGPTGASGVSSALQAGAMLANDGALTINSTSQVTVGAAGQFFVQNAGGVLVPVAIAQTAISAIPAAATYTRLDQVLVDSNGAVSRLAGVETNGATLANRTGAAAIPSGSRLLHDILVTTGGVLAANVRDRRPWARGGYARILRQTNAGGGSNYTTSSTPPVAIDATNLAIRMECSGAPVRVSLRGVTTQDGGHDARVLPYVDGAAIDGMTGQGASAGAPFTVTNPAATFWVPMNLMYEFTPAAGSHLIVPYYSVTAAAVLTVFANATSPLQFIVEEIVRQNASNGTS